LSARAARPKHACVCRQRTQIENENTYLFDVKFLCLAVIRRNIVIRFSVAKRRVVRHVIDNNALGWLTPVSTRSRFGHARRHVGVAVGVVERRRFVVVVEQLAITQSDAISRTHTLPHMKIIRMSSSRRGEHKRAISDQIAHERVDERHLHRTLPARERAHIT
jgi:hypothetical protein